MFQEAVFYSLSALLLLSALCVVLVRNVMHSALFLGLALSAVAGIFATLKADFLFAAQVLVYVGGIAVLLLFVVLLSGRAADLLMRQVNEQWVAALLVCGVIFAALGKVLWEAGSAVARPVEWERATSSLGNFLLSNYAVPFELVSGLLLVSLIGAVIFSREDAPSAPAAESEGGETP
ncbi:MAG: NADH-quinone oxidoreductase subunit J [Elusimicrobia bacterium]|nr:NADH-quinone oxidoreductase subunit J [Elusimicrobiota bacterium]